MKSAFIKKVDGGKSVIEETDFTNSLAVIQNRLLNQILMIAFLLGAVALLITGPIRLQEGKLFALVSYVLIFSWLTVIVFGRQLSYLFRSVSFVILITILSLITLGIDGWVGNGRIFLIAIPVMAAVLLGNKFGLGSLLLTWFILIVTGIGTHKEIISSGFSRIGSHPDVQNWVLATAVFVLVSGVLLRSIHLLLKWMERLLNQGKSLATDLEVERSQLDRRVQLRTSDLERGLDQALKISKISKLLTQNFDVNLVIDDVVRLLHENFKFDGVIFFELAEGNDFAFVKSISGDADECFDLINNRFPVDSNSFYGRSILERKSRIDLDVDRDWSSMDHSILPDSRSVMVFPILAERENTTPFEPINIVPTQNCFGVLAIHSEKPMAFNDVDLSIFQGIADGLETAIENALIFSEIKNRYSEMVELENIKFREAWRKVRQDQGVISFTDSRKKIAEEDSDVSISRLPILLRDQVIGLLTMENIKNNNGNFELTSEDKEYVEAVVSETASALENVRILQLSKKKVEEEHLLSQIIQKTHSASGIESIVRAAIKEICLGLDATEAYIKMEIPFGSIDRSSK